MRQSRLWAPALGVMAALALVSAAPVALAQDDAPVAASDGLDKRLDRIEKQLREVRDIVLQARATGQPVEIKEAGPDPAIAGLTSRLDDMDQSVRGLTGQIETLQHDLTQARQDAASAQAQSAALADRVDKLEKAMATLTPPPPAPGAAPGPAAAGPDGGLSGQAAAQAGGAPPPAADAGPPPDPKAAYAHARQLLLDGDYPSAAAAFQDYVDRFPDTAEAGAARYWIGETKYIQGDYSGAAQAYVQAIHGWPDTSWAPDAVVKLSLSLVELHRVKDACGALTEFERRYPHATPAAKARAEAARQKAGCIR